MSVKVYERILDLFEAEGVNTLFGIPDPNFVHMFQEAEKRGWNVIAPHHEQVAGFMAEAASRITGNPALCIGTLGPGVANLAGAMQCALVEHSPVIFLGGQRARITEQRVRRGRIQFIKQMPLFENSVKYAASVEFPEQTDEIIREGLRKALSGTPGPVYIETPIHIIQEELTEQPILPPSAYRLVKQTAGEDKISEAIKLIQSAKQPVLLVGHGVHCARAAQSVRALAELMACPVIQTSGGSAFIEGIEDRTFPYGFSNSAVDAVTESDLCLAVGTELGEPVHYGVGRHWEKNNAQRKWIYIEQDSTTIGVNRSVDVPLVGDLRAIVPQLTEALKDSPRQATAQLNNLIDAEKKRLHDLAEETPTSGELVHPSRLIVEATKAFPEDGIMVRDGGATTIFAWTYTQSKPKDVMWNQNFGHLGTGLPYAIGASVAEGKKRPLMLITGDSSFQFHISELETAQRLGIPIVCVVACDYAWGLEVGVYKRTFGHDSLETGVHWNNKTRFDKIAEGYDCYGEYIECADDIGPAIKRAYASGKAAVIHVAVDPKANSEEMPNYKEFRTWYAEGMQ
ncbi:MAG: thiamine pyrophosphate-binding protein [Spongiibacteraceae bacterium]|nr:thiamine pyrophosphate-binding protein [Spongiibacteraceae bacterium]MBN4055556.1 thiamine pyrophosphate-binding protein [bacterium AH-315-K03]